MVPRLIKFTTNLAGPIVAFRSAKVAWAFEAARHVRGSKVDFSRSILHRNRFSSLLNSLCYSVALLFTLTGVDLFAGAGG